MELMCKVQNYEWGKRGSKSKVALLLKSANLNFTIDENLPYAELWMGTHINAPSIVKNTDESLANLTLNHPEFLGEEVVRQFGELPFLFKVLSVNKALSIQAHPSKKHAEELHSKFPNIYKDPNHKPEMAIALTTFEALCGFKPVQDIIQYIKEIPELQCIVGTKILDDKSNLIQNAFKAVLTCTKDIITRTIDGLLKRFEQLDKLQYTFFQADLIKRLHSEYPYDNGVLMVYFLNYLNLNPSEALYLGANEPHAYLFGDCIECMACSDNVVRAGLTPKLVDIDTLCSMLIYKGEKPEDKLFSPIPEDQFSVIYKPPVPDFAVVQINVMSKEGTFATTARKSGSILLVIFGRAQYKDGTVVPGTVLFLPAREILTFNNILEDLLIYQAIANV